MTAELVPAGQCDEATARALTLALRQSLTVSCDLLVEAYERRAWAALGYDSWRGYTDTELGEVRLRLPREQRRELVATMTEAGMSTRAIGSALGVDQRTVAADRQSGAEFSAPDEDEPAPDPLAERIARELAASDEGYREQAAQPEPPRVTGTDGKSYPARPAAPVIDEETDRIRRAKEADARRAAEEREARSQLYSGIAKCVQTAAVYGQYEDIPKLMADFDPAELNPPQYEREFRPTNLRAAARFMTELIDWAEAQA